MVLSLLTRLFLRNTVSVVISAENAVENTALILEWAAFVALLICSADVFLLFCHCLCNAPLRLKNI